MMNYGLQMYSVRDITKDDLPGAIAKVAQIGYKLIEFAGFFGHTAEEVNAMLAENNVVVRVCAKVCRRCRLHLHCSINVQRWGVEIT